MCVRAYKCLSVRLCVCVSVRLCVCVSVCLSAWCSDEINALFTPVLSFEYEWNPYRFRVHMHLPYHENLSLQLRITGWLALQTSSLTQKSSL